MNKSDLTPIELIISVSVIIGAFIFIAPFAPPVTGIFAFIATPLIGVAGYHALITTMTILHSTADETLPEIPDEDQNSPVSQETIDEYIEGEMTEDELEKELEKKLEEEMEF